MDLKHDKLTQQEAAGALHVMVNGVQWSATHIAIVQRDGKRPHWVHMKIMDSESGVQFEYFIGRIAMMHAWMALDIGTITAKHISDLVIEFNGNKCTAVDVSDFYNEDEVWIQLKIKCIDGAKQTIAIERQSMINAYYALPKKPVAVVETIREIVEGIAKL